jgi:hypothetical protein
MTLTYQASHNTKAGKVYGYGETAQQACAAMAAEVDGLKAKGVLKRFKPGLVTICEGRSIPQTALFQHTMSDRAVQMLWTEALNFSNKHFPTKEA